MHKCDVFVPVVGAFLHGVVADEIAAAVVDDAVVVVNVQSR